MLPRTSSSNFKLSEAELTGIPTGPAKGLDVRITEVQRTASYVAGYPRNAAGQGRRPSWRGHPGSHPPSKHPGRRGWISPRSSSIWSR
jgi:hypothetical protein